MSSSSSSSSSSSAAAASGAMITLVTQSGERFQVPVASALKCGVVALASDPEPPAELVLAAQVNARSLAIISAFLIYYGKKGNTYTEIIKPIATGGFEAATSAWNAELLATLTRAELCSLIVAADYMHLKDLLDLSCGKLASMFVGKTVDVLRKDFGVRTDFPEAEMAPINEEVKWLEEA
jgi:hypothetical protein